MNMPNLPEWLLYFPIVIPCLLERMLACFNVYTTLEVLALMKTHLETHFL